MGRAIAALVDREADLRVISVWETEEAIGRVSDYLGVTTYSKNPVMLTSDGSRAVGTCDVVVEFTSSGAFDGIVEACVEVSKPLVTGTTAIDHKDAKLARLASKAAVVSAPNMAVGVNVIFGLCEVIGRVIGGSADIEIVESHHRTKKDAPSGTALEMGRILGEAAGKAVAVGRHLASGERTDEIFIHSLRVGDVAGKHTIVVSPRGETLEITHTAQSRECFAAGALHAARFAADSPPGLYTMLDVLNLR